MAAAKRQTEEATIGAEPPVEMPVGLEASAPDVTMVSALVTGGAAHDLNNVLALLLMQIDVLGESTSAEEARELLDGMRGGLRRGVSIAETLLRQAQAEAGQRVPLNPKLLVTGLQKRCRTLLGEDVAITAHYPEGLPQVAVEPRVMFAVLLRLCRLALETTPGRTLALRVEPLDGDADGKTASGAFPAVVLSIAARGWRVGEADGEIGEGHPLLGDVAAALARHGGRVLTVPSAGAIRLVLPFHE